ncbi:MAG: alkaline phosphatase family protein [Gemmatimonadaceae bacterium]
MPVIVIVADGARPDILASAMKRGIVPSFSRLRDEGGMHTLTSVFPSVTGPAYAPFLMGRFPGPIGLPGLRWYDRGRKTSRLPGHSRSYVGFEMRRIDSDIDAAAPTIFDLIPSSIAALNVINRGLPKSNRIGYGLPFVARTTKTHFSGNLGGWQAIDKYIAGQVADQIRRKRPDFAFAALMGIDKTSHSEGHSGANVDHALAIIDDAVAEIRHDAEKRGQWQNTHLWIVSDHGHSPVVQHEDLAGFVGRMGFRTIAHPFVYTPGAEAAVMVSGNAMAHIYLDLALRERPYLPSMPGRWQALKEALLARDSVDLMIVPVSPGACDVYGRGRGHARMDWNGLRISYRPLTGDPLGLGLVESLSEDETYELTISTDYPDSLVQISRISDSPRSGEMIISAARDWDLRSKYEPIPHFSSHGALHRDHMLVPFIMNKAAASRPCRTVDVMPSALAATGVSIPKGLDGRSFL